MVEQAVLIVEDEPSLLRLFNTVISHIAPNFAVLTASGGAAAIAMLEAGTPKLLLLDMALPHVDGNEVIAFILGQERLAEMVILVITAVPSRLKEQYRARVSAVLAKPLTPRDLERLILPHLT